MISAIVAKDDVEKTVRNYVAKIKSIKKDNFK